MYALCAIVRTFATDIFLQHIFFNQHFNIMDLTSGVLINLGFTQKGKKYTKWMLDLHEDEPGVFSVNLGRIYFDIETVNKLQDFWNIIGAESVMPLIEKRQDSLC